MNPNINDIIAACKICESMKQQQFQLIQQIKSSNEQLAICMENNRLLQQENENLRLQLGDTISPPIPVMFNIDTDGEFETGSDSSSE